MAFSELELKQIDKLVGGLCRDRSTKKNADELRFSYEVNGHDVVLFEERPRYDNPAEWNKFDIAKFKKIRSKNEWKLYWMQRDLKWHPYDPESITIKTLDALVRVVAEDKLTVFFG
jgi:Protein of unknown function (DUF3024)